MKQHRILTTLLLTALACTGCASPTPSANTPPLSETRAVTQTPTTQKPTEAPTTQKPTEASTTQNPTEASTTQPPTQAPTTQKPTQAPAQAAEAPAPAAEAPAPVEEAPASVEEAPAPVEEAPAPVADAPEPAAAQPQTKAPEKPSISGRIIIEYPSYGEGDGVTFYLQTSGNYAYYAYEGRGHSADGSYDVLRSGTTNEPGVKLGSASCYPYVTAVLVPYSSDGTPGESVTCRADWGAQPKQQEPSKVESCCYYGKINTRGYKIASFTTSYVAENGAESYVYESLGDGWYVTAIRHCYSRSVDWYELVDTDTGAYYGWVDLNFIDFF